MIRRNKKQKRYHSPQARVTQVALESNFCNTNLKFSIEVDELQNRNAAVDENGVPVESFYFDM